MGLHIPGSYPGRTSAANIRYHHVANLYRRGQLHRIQQRHGIVNHPLGNILVGLNRQTLVNPPGDLYRGSDNPRGIGQLLLAVVNAPGTPKTGDLVVVVLVHSKVAPLGADDADQICHGKPSLTASPP